MPTSLDVAASEVDAGLQTTVSFSVQNQGKGTAFGTWLDQLWLSTNDEIDNPGDIFDQLWLSADGKIDNPGDVFLKNVNRFDPLAPGASYDVLRESITIPPGTAPGQYFLLLRANTTGQLFEAGRMANNDWPAPIPITVE